MEKLKTIRDYAMADGSLARPRTPRAGSLFACTHGLEQAKWLDHKVKVFEALGFNCRTYEYTCEGFNGPHTTRRFYTQNTQEVARLYEAWYHKSPTKNKWYKNYKAFLQAAPFDTESLVIFFLDNGGAAMKKRYFNYQYGIKADIAPFIDKFLLSTSYQDSTLFEPVLESIGIEAKGHKPFEKKSFVSITKIDSKLKIKNLVKDFCEKNSLTEVFGYKYDHPIALSQVERLSGRNSHMGPKRTNVGVCDSLISANNQLNAERADRRICPATEESDVIRDFSVVTK